MKAIILTHPNRQSLNGAIADRAIEILEERKEKYTLIDLYRDGFDPVLRNLSNFVQGLPDDELTARYVDILKAANSLLFIFPMWWSDMPAMLKGFLDKTLLPHFAYKHSETGIVSNIKNIARADIITTAATPEAVLREYCGSPFETVFINAVLKQIGIAQCTWQHFSDLRDEEKRKSFLLGLKKVL